MALTRIMPFISIWSFLWSSCVHAKVALNAVSKLTFFKKYCLVFQRRIFIVIQNCGRLLLPVTSTLEQAMRGKVSEEERMVAMLLVKYGQQSRVMAIMLVGGIPGKEYLVVSRICTLSHKLCDLDTSVPQSLPPLLTIWQSAQRRSIPWGGITCGTSPVSPS